MGVFDIEAEGGFVRMSTTIIVLIVLHPLHYLKGLMIGLGCGATRLPTTSFLDKQALHGLACEKTYHSCPSRVCKAVLVTEGVFRRACNGFRQDRCSDVTGAYANNIARQEVHVHDELRRNIA